MIVKDAWWDTRNLEVRCAEIEFDANDSIGEVYHALDTSSQYDYVTAKIPSGRIDLLHELENNGFQFVEALIEMRHDLKEILCSPIVRRVLQNVSYNHAESETDLIFDKIRDGVFDTDRVFLDKHFSHEAAANRYINWIKDELKKGATLFNICYKDTNVGFFSFKITDNNVGYPFLSGIYNSDVIGIGNAVVTEPLKHAQETGCRYVCTHVSSNNIPIIRIHEQAGFYTSSIQYVLTIHRP